MLGAPWKAREIINEIEGKEKQDVDLQEKLNIILEHLNLAVEEKGEYVGIREMRKHICWYLKNLKDSSKIREEINRLETKRDVEDTLIEYFNTL